MCGLEVFNVSLGAAYDNLRDSYLLQGQLPLHTLGHILLGIRFVHHGPANQ